MNLPSSSKAQSEEQLEISSKAQGDEQQQYLTFTLVNEMYAMGILHVKEIIQYGQLTPVPMVPKFIRGVINLRGAVVPVIDLTTRFGGHSSKVDKRTCIVIVEITYEDERQDIGVMVDSVSAVLDIPPDQIEPAPEFGAKIRTDFIQGMGKVGDKFVIILSINNVLSIDELTTISQMSKVTSDS